MYRENHQKARLAAFFSYLKQLGYRPATQKNIQRAVEEFTAWRQDKPITASLLQAYYDYLSQRPKQKGQGALSSSTVASHLYALRIYCQYLLDQGRLAVHPMSGLSFPRPDRRPREILTPEEVARLYEVAQKLLPPENYTAQALLAVCYGCGLRRREVERLNLRDVDFGNRILYVREGKGGKARSVPMSRQVVEELKTWLEKGRPRRGRYRRDPDAFFIGRYGSRMQGESFDRILRNMVREAGIRKRITLHSLRHSIATHLLNQGLPLESVRDFLGHARLESTQIYTRVT